ncbi:MAG: PAS domain-containing protein, partial [Myxococcales bacterium]|nr:PAS domain-containing protein [Myxococcales bacterium]
ETLLECLEQPVFVHDRRGIVVRANKPALRLLERPVLSTVTGRSALVDLCACLGADRRPFDRETDPALVARRTGKAQSAVMGLTSSTGEVVWFRVSAFPVLVDGEVDTTIVTLSGTAPP